ncbi:MAG TPA: glycerophosphodiester phosphodiesterase family protein, partial [Opitutus sp.]|nr:glycerophosphodiester phosphodiesterase family protein [Opitutus sp.]
MSLSALFARNRALRGVSKLWTAVPFRHAVTLQLIGSPRRCLIGGALLALLAFGTTGQAKLILVGHRGASVDAPENTLAALNRAKACADFVEFDVRSTKDGHLVVIHDATLDRTTNGRGEV